LHMDFHYPSRLMWVILVVTPDTHLRCKGTNDNNNDDDEDDDYSMPLKYLRCDFESLY
jgi:hypothetical protein